MYHELFQDNYKNTKQHTEDFMHKYTQASEKIASTININPTTTQNIHKLRHAVHNQQGARKQQHN